MFIGLDEEFVGIEDVGEVDVDFVCKVGVFFVEVLV